MPKTATLAILLALALLFVATSFTRSEAREREARRYFTQEEIAKGQAYSRGNRLLFWGSVALDLLILYVLVGTPTGAGWLRAVEGLAGGRFILAVLAVAASAPTNALATPPRSAATPPASAERWPIASTS